MGHLRRLDAFGVGLVVGLESLLDKGLHSSVLLGGLERPERGLRQTCCAMVWVAPSLESLVAIGVEPAAATAILGARQLGLVVSLGNRFQTTMERPNLHNVKAFLSHRMATLGAGWILLWLLIAMVGSPLRPDPSPMANDQHLDRGLLSPGAVWEDASGTSHLSLIHI